MPKPFSSSRHPTLQQDSLTSFSSRLARYALLCAGAMAVATAHGQQTPVDAAGEVVVTANRTGQRRFDAAASIDAVVVDSFKTASPLVNLSELLSGVPGLQVRERQNYAQDHRCRCAVLVHVRPLVCVGSAY